MLSPRASAIERLLSKFAEPDDELLRKHSPKALSVEVVKPAHDELDGDELPPEVLDLVKALTKGDEDTSDALDEHAEDEDAEKLADGGMVMGDTKCPGCGHMKSDCRCDKMSEGGLIEGESLSDEQMKRREEGRKADASDDASRDMEELAGGHPSPKGYKVRKYAQGGVVSKPGISEAQKEDSALELEKEEEAEQYPRRAKRPSRYYKG